MRSSIEIFRALSSKPSVLRIVDIQPAGRVSKRRVETGTAIKVMTGLSCHRAPMRSSWWKIQFLTMIGSKFSDP
jgi:hypothetical protein